MADNLVKLVGVWAETTKAGDKPWPEWIADRVIELANLLREVEFSDTREGCCPWCGESGWHNDSCRYRAALRNLPK